MIEDNVVEIDFESTVPIKGSCHKDFQDVAEIFAENFNKLLAQKSQMSERNNQNLKN